MFGGGKGFAGSGGGSDDEAEEVFLNLTPMIDILTCLLFFLLLSFGAVLIALINASVPVIADGDPSTQQVSKLKVTMGLSISDKGMLATVSHDQIPEEELAKMKRFFPKKKNEHTFAELHEYLWGIKRKYPNSSSIIITPQPAITYDVIVAAMDASRDRPGGTQRKPIKIPMFPEAVISTIVE